MKKELEAELVAKYPNIFVNYGGDPRQTCLAWGMECGNGWHGIIDTLCRVLENMGSNIRRRWSDKHPDMVFQVRAEQVKEKYGTLRFYIHIDCPEPEGCDERVKNDIRRTVEAVHGAITMAEAMSACTCENCGAVGRIDGSEPWLRCECDKCMEERIGNSQKENG